MTRCWFPAPIPAIAQPATSSRVSDVPFSGSEDITCMQLIHTQAHTMENSGLLLPACFLADKHVSSVDVAATNLADIRLQLHRLPTSTEDQQHYQHRVDLQLQTEAAGVSISWAEALLSSQPLQQADRQCRTTQACLLQANLRSFLCSVCSICCLPLGNPPVESC